MAVHFPFSYSLFLPKLIQLPCLCVGLTLEFGQFRRMYLDSPHLQGKTETGQILVCLQAKSLDIHSDVLVHFLFQFQNIYYWVLYEDNGVIWSTVLEGD